MQDNFGHEIDLDIKNTIMSLTNIKGKIINNKQTMNNVFHNQEQTLVTLTADGYCQALSLEQAKEVIDYTWDHLFPYANDAQSN